MDIECLGNKEAYILLYFWLGPQRLPAPMPLVPGEQAVGEAVVAPARELPEARQPDEPAEPAPPRRHRPHRDRHVGADQQAALFVDHVQAVADLIDAAVD